MIIKQRLSIHTKDTVRVRNADFASVLWLLWLVVGKVEAMLTAMSFRV